MLKSGKRTYREIHYVGNCSDLNFSIFFIFNLSYHVRDDDIMVFLLGFGLILKTVLISFIKNEIFTVNS